MRRNRVLCVYGCRVQCYGEFYVAGSNVLWELNVAGSYMLRRVNTVGSYMLSGASALMCVLMALLDAPAWLNLLCMLNLLYVVH
ncbi:hypothetical protein D3C75_200580 [compost metagenome]